MNEMNNSGKKISFAMRLKSKAVKLGRVFREYPLTLGCIVIIAAIGAVIVDCNFDTEWCERSILFLAAFSAQTLFLEEYFKYKRTIRIAGYMIAIPVAALLTYLFWFEGEFFLGMDIVKAREVFRDLYISYFACLGLASLYHMYRRLKDPFEAYCLKTFFGLLRTSVVYGLFAKSGNLPCGRYLRSRDAPCAVREEGRGRQVFQSLCAVCAGTHADPGHGYHLRVYREDLCYK